MKTLNSLIIILVLLFPAQKSFAGWTEQNSGVTTILNDVCFVDSLHGWAVGDSATIVSTVDGGDTWLKQDCPEEYNEKYYYTKVSFLNEKLGFIIGESIIRLPYEKRLHDILIKTIDGGITWDKVFENAAILSVFIVDENTQWISTGDSLLTGGTILKTIDSGKTWESVHIESGYVTSLNFLNEKEGWATYVYQDGWTPGKIIKTSDGGNTWDVFFQDNTHRITDIYPLTTEAFFIMDSKIAKTNNGGLSWNWIDVQSVCKDFDYENADKFCTLSIKSGNPFSYIISCTDNGGFSFRTTEFNDMLLALSFVGHNIIAVGLNGKIIKYTENESFIEKNNENANNPLFLYQNYPNSFNPITTICYSIANPGHVSLSVYNIAGQKVATLVNGNMSIGNHSVSFDGSSLASGVYFYRLETGKFNKSGKMLLVK